MTQRERYLLNGVRVCLALVCLIPLVVSYTTVFPFVVGKSLLARSLVEIAFAGWLLLAWRAPEYRPRPSVILLALLAWLGVSTLAALLGVNVGRSLWSGYERMHGVVELAHWCGFILVAASVFRTFPAWQALLGVHLAVGAAVSALGLAGYLGLVGWVWVFSEVARAGSTLGSGLFLGAYAAMNAGFGVALLLCPWRDHWRWRGAWTRYLVAAAVVLNLAALWTSAARSGLLGVVAMALVFAAGALLLDRRRMVVGAALAALTVLVAVTAVGLLGGSLGLPAKYDVMSRRLSVAVAGEEGRSARNRLNTLRIGLEAYRERPLLGWGPENYRSAWGRHITVDEYSGHSVDQAHNKALDTLVSTGTAGFFCLLGALAGAGAHGAAPGAGPGGRGAAVCAGHGRGAGRVSDDQPVPVRHPVLHAAVRAGGRLLRVPGTRGWGTAADLAVLAVLGSPVVRRADRPGPPAVRGSGGGGAGGGGAGLQPGPVERETLPGGPEHRAAADLAGDPAGGPGTLPGISAAGRPLAHRHGGQHHQRHAVSSRG